MAEICRRHGVPSAQIYEWKQKALASMKAGLKGPGGNPDTVLRQENLRLKKVVADLTIADDVLKEYLEGSAPGKKRRRELVRAMKARWLRRRTRAAASVGLARRSLDD